MLIKKLVCVSAMLIAATGFSACPTATPTDSAAFCSSFKTAAECHCTSSGLPKGMCTNMGLLYSRMISTFGTVQRACQFQHDTSTEICIDDWNCYRQGGLNKDNQLCSSTGSACE